LCFAESYVLTENLYLRINICAGNPAHRKCSKH